jgi:hypothetical protein
VVGVWVGRGGNRAAKLEATLSAALMVALGIGSLTEEQSATMGFRKRSSAVGI